MLYERLHRLLVDLGARPAALDADTHDALLATVSHLPHVLANVLVARAARVLSEEGERLPATGPSFRDATRVAGANTAIWRDIYLANADALVDAIDDTVRRLDEVRGGARGARRRRRGGLERRRARGAPAAAGGRPGGRRGARAARRRSPTGPGVVAEVALALGRAGVNILDMALYPASDMSSGTIALWVAGDGARRRGAGARRGPRADGGAAVNVRFAPDGPLRGTLAAPPDKSLSHRAALLAAMTDEPVTITGYLDAADTNSTLAAVQALGALVERRDGSLVVRGAGPAGGGAGRADRRRQRGHADAAAAGLAGRAGGRALDARRRRLDPAPAGRPRRGAAGADGRARSTPREGRFPPFTVTGAPLSGSSTSCRSPPRRSSRACCSPGCWPPGRRRSSSRKPSRDHTERMLAAAGVRIARDGDRITVAAQDELELGALHVPGDPSSAAFHAAAAVLVPRLADRHRGHGRQLDAHRLLPHPAAHGRRRGRAAGGARRRRADARSRSASSTSATARSVGTVVEPEEVPLAIDELPLVALLGCFAEGETVVRGAGELRLKESDRIATVVDGLRGLGARDRGDRGRLRGRGHRRAARRRARGPRRPPAGDARRRRRPGVARGRRGGRDGGRRRLLSRLRGRPRRAARLMGQFHFHPDEYLALMRPSCRPTSGSRTPRRPRPAAARTRAARARHRHGGDRAPRAGPPPGCGARRHRRQRRHARARPTLPGADLRSARLEDPLPAGPVRPRLLRARRPPPRRAGQGGPLPARGRRARRRAGASCSPTSSSRTTRPTPSRRSARTRPAEPRRRAAGVAGRRRASSVASPGPSATSP